LLRQIIALVFSFLFSAALTAQSAPPERKVAGNVIVSERDPVVRIELPKDAQYVGADRWALYGIADCELHAWVEAADADAQTGVQQTDAQPKDGRSKNVRPKNVLPKSVRRLYWVQFEGYLASRPDLHHTYDSPKHATIGGMDFFVDSWVRGKDAKTEAGSDREHIEALVAAKGYRMPEAMYVRLVHLLDKEKRKELMIIYGEDIAATGFSAGELSEGGKDYDRWAGIADGLLERAERDIRVEFAKP
jgi:hypothetical protein